MAKVTTKNVEPVEQPEPESAVEAEAVGADEITVEYGGHDYTVPATVDDWSIDALEAAERGSPSGVLREVLGNEQYRAFKLRHRTVRDLRALSEKIAAVSGFDSLGN